MISQKGGPNASWLLRLFLYSLAILKQIPRTQFLHPLSLWPTMQLFSLRNLARTTDRTRKSAELFEAHGTVTDALWFFWIKKPANQKGLVS